VTASSARRIALEALLAVEDGAFANLVLPKLLASSSLERRDRDLATNLVYGVTRMRRALDWLIAQRGDRDLEIEVRTILRLGLFQLFFLEMPAHAAVSESVDLAIPRARGFINAVLRRASEAGAQWPDEATELSYPDWIIERMTADLGRDDALGALARMNTPPPVSRREDGYFQDVASQWVVAEVDGALPEGGLVVDLCAAPGGKATGLATRAGLVVASDLQPHRVGLVASNIRRTGTHNVAAVVADGRRPPVRPGVAEVVLVDAPCSGLGALRRRPDARWRIREQDVSALVALQKSLLESAARLVAPGGLLAYSVCTMTAAETVGVDDWLSGLLPDWKAVALDPARWRPSGRGGLLLPQDHDTDAMFLLMLRRPAQGTGS